MAAPLRACRSMIQAGASIAWANDTVRGNSIAMRDPEGNEFCVS